MCYTCRTYISIIAQRNQNDLCANNILGKDCQIKAEKLQRSAGAL